MTWQIFEVAVIIPSFCFSMWNSSLPPTPTLRVPPKTLSLEGTHQCLTHHMDSTNNYCLGASFLFSFTLWLLIGVLFSISGTCFCKILPICLPKVHHWSLPVTLIAASHLASELSLFRQVGPTKPASQMKPLQNSQIQGKETSHIPGKHFHFIEKLFTIHEVFINALF